MRENAYVMHPFYLLVTITLCQHLLPALVQYSERPAERLAPMQPGKTHNQDAACTFIRHKASSLKTTRTKLPDFSSKVCDLHTDFLEENVSKFGNE
jgi:hypothetical protein